MQTEIYHDDYGNDIYKWMLVKEDRLPKLRFISPQFEFRPSMIDWLCNACKIFSLSPGTQHLSVQFMDCFMDNFKTDEDQLMLLCMACLRIAAKFEEKEVDIPLLQEVLQVSGASYSRELYQCMEIEVLKNLQWRTNLPTYVNFSDYYVKALVDSSDLVNGELLNSDKACCKVKAICERHLTCFSHLVLEDISYRNYRPSLLAATVIAIVRCFVQLQPAWPLRLEKLTGYGVAALHHPMQQLISDYNRKVPPDQMEEGLLQSEWDLFNLTDISEKSDSGVSEC